MTPDCALPNPFFPLCPPGCWSHVWKTTTIRLQRGKMRKNVSMRFTRWFMASNVDGFVFPLAEEEDTLVKLISWWRQFLSHSPENLLHPLSLLLCDIVQAGFDATRVFHQKGCKQLPLSEIYKALFVTPRSSNWLWSHSKQHQLPIDTNLTYFAANF